MITQSPMAIKLERFIKATPMEVWEAIVNPDKFFLTFVGIQFMGPFETGKMTPVGAGDDVGLVFVEEATPVKRLAIRWNYDPVDAKTFIREKSTLLEFELIEKDGGTLLKFSESEFENLPEEIRAASFRNVSLGWPSMIETVGDLVERGEDAWLIVQSFGMVKAPIEKIWNAVLEFKPFTQLEKFEGEVKVGEVVVLYFGNHHAGLPILITKVEDQPEMKELEFRWHHTDTDPTAPFDPAETSVVSISMIQMEEGVWVIFRESEFDKVPDAIRKSIYEQQAKGWEGGVETFSKALEEGGNQ